MIPDTRLTRLGFGHLFSDRSRLPDLPLTDVRPLTVGLSVVPCLGKFERPSIWVEEYLCSTP